MGRPHQMHSSPAEKEDKFNLYIQRISISEQVKDGSYYTKRDQINQLMLTLICTDEYQQENESKGKVKIQTKYIKKKHFLVFLYMYTHVHVLLNEHAITSCGKTTCCSKYCHDTDICNKHHLTHNNCTCSD